MWGQKVKLGRPGFGSRGPKPLWPCRPHLQRSPRPTRHSQRKRGAAGASSEVRASGSLFQRFASLRRTGAGTRWHLPGSATPAAKDHNPVRTTPWGHWCRGAEHTEPGRREAPPQTRQCVPGQCAAPSLRAALGETLVCRVACREEGTKGGLYAPRLVRLGPGSPHLQRTLTLQCPEWRARPGASRGSPGCRGLSRDCPAILGFAAVSPSSLPRRA